VLPDPSPIAAVIVKAAEKAFPLPQPTTAELLPDSPAAFEQTAIALGVDIEHQRAKNDLNKLLRSDNLELHIHRIVKLIMWVVCVLGLTGVSFFGYHHLTPGNLHFLTDAQVDDIKSMLFSGGMGAAISFAAQRYLGK
jgi:hypothetical protein